MQREEWREKQSRKIRTFGAEVAEQSYCLPSTKANLVPSRLLKVGIVPDDAIGRKGFLGDLPFSPLLHSGVAPFSPHFTLTCFQDLDVTSRPYLSAHSNSYRGYFSNLDDSSNCNHNVVRMAHSPPTTAKRVQSPDGSPTFRKWESCRTMTLVGGFSRESPVSPAPSSRHRSNPPPPPYALKISLLRATQISSRRLAYFEIQTLYEIPPRDDEDPSSMSFDNSKSLLEHWSLDFRGGSTSADLIMLPAGIITFTVILATVSISTGERVYPGDPGEVKLATALDHVSDSLHCFQDILQDSLHVSRKCGEDVERLTNTGWENVEREQTRNWKGKLNRHGECPLTWSTDEVFNCDTSASISHPLPKNSLSVKNSSVQ
ncbi:hypothetical protein PR048_022582 [Dryococelus australis]|uniref:Uncharacterized protein n=1 Tax=Dryococelus australis TaxID=614101 RepID=A0ABQ9H1D2_9NEOP|nr:hypothetical protein PR048_022582 [Dryococelus australis]